MIEPAMYFALGFLVAGLFALAILPHVHARAVRLAARRLMAEIPVSMAEIRADKDLLRAQFAMSARRFETSIEQLKTKMASQLVELGRKSDEVNRLKLELGEKTVCALEGRNQAPEDQLLAAAAAPSVMTAPRIDQRSLAGRLAELATLNPDLDESPVVPSPPMPLFGQTRKENNVRVLSQASRSPARKAG